MRTFITILFFSTTWGFSICEMPFSLNVTDVTDTTVTFGLTYGDCGGVVRVFEAGSTVLLQTYNTGPFLQEITVIGLSPNTEYDFFAESICEVTSSKLGCLNTETSFSFFFQIMTEPPGCNPPSGLLVEKITTDSLRFQANIGAEGGVVMLKRGSTPVAQFSLNPGTQSVNFNGLQPSTNYTACFFNWCMGVPSDNACISATTFDVCRLPSGFAASELTPISFVGTWDAGPFGGRAWLYLNPDEYVEFLVEPGRSSFSTMDQLTLNPDTQYIICLFNACDEFRLEYTAEVCELVRTPPENCEPPALLEFSAITSDSFRVRSEFGPFGGIAEVSSPFFDAIMEFAADETEKTIAGVPSDTVLNVAVRNKCFDGSTTDAIVDQVHTFSANAANGLLTAPTFINERNVWVGEDLRIRVLLTDPNSDGWAQAQETPLVYVIRLVQDCEVTFEVELNPSTYPVAYEIPRGIPLDPYEIHVLRKTRGTTKDGEQESTGSVIVGPPRDSGPTVISTNFTEIQRWVLHVPKRAGGFQGWLTFQNRFPTLPSTLWVAGFDASGAYINGTARPLQILGLRAEIPIYATQGGKASLFSENMTDQVSHIGLMEQGNLKNLRVSITYQNISDPDALTASLLESDFASGEALGSSFTMEARKSENFWDGAAILNLSGNQSAQVEIVQRKHQGDVEMGRASLGTIAPGQKSLTVISDLFGFCGDCYYNIEAADPKAKVSILGLRGSLVGTAVLVGSEVQKKR